ncbi:MAG: YitT family protein [Clostridia bacterium]|nr:YitT family protein [Clostridia bacterium]
MKHKAALLKILKTYSIITLGCVVYSIGVGLFLDPNNIASGGVTGIAIILSYLIGESTWLNTGMLIIFINIPLLILGFVFFGKKFVISTAYSTIVSSLMVDLWQLIIKDMPTFSDDLLIPAVIGGSFFGLGIGIIFRMGSSTGGTDIIVKILRKKFRHIKTGVISMSIDLCIIGVSGLIFKDFVLTCYTAVSIVMFTLMFDWVLYGGNSAKLVHIITDDDKAEEMCGKILKELDVGATIVGGKGAYTDKSKTIIFCAIKNFLYPKLRDVVREVDPHAFTIVSSVKEIYGEGYKNHTDDEL